MENWLGGINSISWMFVLLQGAFILPPHPGSEKVSTEGCGGGMCAALELQSPLNLLDWVDWAGRQGEPHHIQRGGWPDDLTPQTPPKGCSVHISSVGLLCPPRLCHPTHSVTGRAGRMD